MKVLIIDDEADIRRIIRIGLDRAGFMTVCEATGGLDGIIAARQEMPDTILLDVKMPGMDGPAVLRALRANPETAAIPVVFLTASAAPEELARIEGLGAAGVIAKPFDPMTLADQLHALLEHRQGSAAADLATVLTSLNHEYRRDLPAKIARLSDLAWRADEAPDDADTRAEFATAVHNLHGTAGTYGFARISRIAGEWDAELKADAGKMPYPSVRVAHYIGALSSYKAATEEPPLSFLAAQPVAQPMAPPADAQVILIVDDDPDLAAFFAALLRTDGMRVETASDGRAALARLSVSRPALIISDISMPGMNGYELCRTIRSQGFQDVPFIFCTALGEKPQRVEGLWCGADDYLVKPIEPEELRLTVRKHIARIKRLSELTPAPDLVHGNLAEVELTLVLQMLGQRKAAGATRLMLRRDDETGAIHFDGNLPVHAVQDQCSGPKAFFRLLDWQAGEFRLERADPAPAITLSGGLEGLLLEGRRHLDESRLLKSRLQRLELSPQAKAAEHAAPADIRWLLAGVQQGRSLEDLLNMSPLPDLDVLRKLNTLAGSGVLQRGTAA